MRNLQNASTHRRATNTPRYATRPENLVIRREWYFVGGVPQKSTTPVLTINLPSGPGKLRKVSGAHRKMALLRYSDLIAESRRYRANDVLSSTVVTCEVETTYRLAGTREGHYRSRHPALCVPVA